MVTHPFLTPAWLWRYKPSSSVSLRFLRSLRVERALVLPLHPLRFNRTAPGMFLLGMASLPNPVYRVSYR